jgi:hypothetical protein
MVAANLDAVAARLAASGELASVAEHEIVRLVMQ